MAIRVVLGFLFVLGLATAWCSQLGEGVVLTATSSIRQAIDGQEQKPEIARVRELLLISKTICGFGKRLSTRGSRL